MSNGPETLIGQQRRLSTGSGREKNEWTDLTIGKNLNPKITLAKKGK